LHRPFDARKARAEYRDGFFCVYIPTADRPIRHVVTITLT
jgi:hypothetical protein